MEDRQQLSTRQRSTRDAILLECFRPIAASAEEWRSSEVSLASVSEGNGLLGRSQYKRVESPTQIQRDVSMQLLWKLIDDVI